jgi:hypothetical protein
MSTVIYQPTRLVGDGEDAQLRWGRQDKRAAGGARTGLPQPALLEEQHRAQIPHTKTVHADLLDLSIIAIQTGKLVQSTNWIPPADAEEIQHLARIYGMSKSQIGAVLIHMALEIRIRQREAALWEAKMEQIAHKYTTKLSRIDKRLDDIEQVGLENQQLIADVLKRQGERPTMPPEQFNPLYDDARKTAKGRLFQRRQQRRNAESAVAQGMEEGREPSSLWQ